MPLYERSVGFASVQSLCAFISGFLALLAPPVASTLSISTTFSKAHPSPRPAPPHLPPLLKVRCCRPKKFGRLPEGLLLHQPSQNRTIPCFAPSHLPPLSKGGGLTARHKLLLCCVLLAICPPFLCYKLFCRQDGGIVTPSPLPKPHYHTRFSYCNRLCVLIRFCI